MNDREVRDQLRGLELARQTFVDEMGRMQSATGKAFTDGASRIRLLAAEANEKYDAVCALLGLGIPVNLEALVLLERSREQR